MIKSALVVHSPTRVKSCNALRLCFVSSGLFLFAVATFFLATFLPANNAHAGSALTGTVTLDVQYVCHDGGNRGFSPKIFLTKHSGTQVRGEPPGTQWTSRSKAYYDPTECYDLSTGFSRGDIVYVWHSRDRSTRQCPLFRLKFVPNRTDIWVQNLGGTAFNVSCIAKWSLKGHINSPQKRILKVYQASAICHDGANRGAEARIQVSDGNDRWAPHGITFKGYYTKTQCFEFPLLRDGTNLAVYHQRRNQNEEHNTGIKDRGYVEWCDDFVVKINKNAKPMWVQTTGTTIWNMGCRAKRRL